MVEIKPCVIQCDSCCEVIEVFIDVECTDNHERSMGSELLYEGEIECQCPMCDSPISISQIVNEYPENNIEFQNTSVTGATILQFPEYDPFD